MEDNQILTTLDIEVVSRIRRELSIKLIEIAKLVNENHSSSIGIDVLRQIFESVTYVIEIALKNKEDKLYALKNESINSLYNEGLLCINKKIVKVQKRHKLIRDNLFKSANIFYSSTIVDGISAFFKVYNPALDAKNHHINGDYPTYYEISNLYGIEYIEKYLYCLEKENYFLMKFSNDDVEKYLDKLDFDWRNSPINIFEYVLMSALLLVMIKRKPDDLNIVYSDLKEYENILRQNDIDTLVDKGIKDLKEYLNISKDVYNYLKLLKEKIILNINICLKEGNLGKLFALAPDKTQDIVFKDEESLLEKDYQKILSVIEASQNKAELILKYVHSYNDLIDIIGDLFIDEEDYKEFVSYLSNREVEYLYIRLRTNIDFLNEIECQLYKTICEIKKVS